LSCGRFFPASSSQWHRWRGQAISRHDGIVPTFPWQRTSCYCERDGRAVSTNLPQQALEFLAVQSRETTPLELRRAVLEQLSN